MNLFKKLRKEKVPICNNIERLSWVPNYSWTTEAWLCNHYTCRVSIQVCECLSWQICRIKPLCLKGTIFCKSEEVGFLGLNKTRSLAGICSAIKENIIFIKPYLMLSLNHTCSFQEWVIIFTWDASLHTYFLQNGLNSAVWTYVIVRWTILQLIHASFCSAILSFKLLFSFKMQWPSSSTKTPSFSHICIVGLSSWDLMTWLDLVLLSFALSIS